MKRVVGLPGESVAIRNGDVWINGVVAAKRLDELQSLAIRVAHGQDFARQWRSADADRWRFDADKASLIGSSPQQSLAWLSFQPIARWSNESKGASTLSDESPCDQNESRELNSVDDVLLACHAKVAEAGTVCLRLRSRGDTFSLELDAVRGEGRLLRGGVQLSVVSLPANALGQTTRVELAVADRRVQWALGGKTLASCDFAPTEGVGEGPLAAIGARGSAVELRCPEVFRDIYYTPASLASSQYRLGPDEYFVLSDNSAHGADSREWTALGGVTGDLLVGAARWW